MRCKNESPVDERRIVQRWHFGRFPAVRYLVKPSFRSRWALVKDISARGIGLVAGAEASFGDVLAIELRRTAAGESHVVRARLRSATRMADGRWLLGCDFVDSLRPDVLSDLVQEDLS